MSEHVIQIVKVAQDGPYGYILFDVNHVLIAGEARTIVADCASPEAALEAALRLIGKPLVRALVQATADDGAPKNGTTAA